MNVCSANGNRFDAHYVAIVAGSALSVSRKIVTYKGQQDIRILGVTCRPCPTAIGSAARSACASRYTSMSHAGGVAVQSLEAAAATAVSSDREMPHTDGDTLAHVFNGSSYRNLGAWRNAFCEHSHSAGVTAKNRDWSHRAFAQADA